jgi:hypothetical protein
VSATGYTIQNPEKNAKEPAKIPVPTMILHGDSDPLYPTSASEGQESLFTSFYERRILSQKLCLLMQKVVP